MTIYFVYRGNDAGPACKYVHRVKANSILDVFRANWQPVADPDECEEEVLRHGESVFGPGYICLHELPFAIVENDWPPPKSVQELHGRLEQMAGDGMFRGLTFGPHHIAILDTEDVFEFALYAFDDHYAAEHPDRVAFLLPDGWELPDGTAEAPFMPTVDCPRAPQTFRGEGHTFVAFLGVEDHFGLTNLGAGANELLWQIDGVRLPDLPRYLFTVPVGEAADYPPVIRYLAEGLRMFVADLTGDERALVDAVRSNPLEEVTWAIYSDWLGRRAGQRAGARLTAAALRRCRPSGWYDPADRPHDVVVAHPRVAQACKRLSDFRGKAMFHHIILFDDRWAAVDPDVANSILRFASRWDVL
jgi:hypothetical protein